MENNMTDKQNIENTESIVQETETSVDLTKTLSQAGKKFLKTMKIREQWAGLKNSEHT